MGCFVIIAVAFVVMLLIAGVTVLKCCKFSRSSVGDTLRRVYVRISRYAGIIFILFLLLALSYEQVKELVNNFLPAQNIEQIKLYIKLIFRSESVFSAVEAVAVYSLIVSCWSGLGAIFVRIAQRYVEYNSVSFRDADDNHVSCSSTEKLFPVKSFLVYSRYNS